MLPEFCGDFPIAKINHFAVYLACLRVLQKIAFLHADVASSMPESEHARASLGMQIVTNLFAKVDKDQRDKGTEKILPYLSCLHLSKEALLHVLQGMLSPWRR